MQSSSKTGFQVWAPKVDYSKNQIDLIVTSMGPIRISRTIEVRSSYSYKAASIERVVTGAFSLLGPYITSSKPEETAKDFHVTVVHRIDPRWLETVTKKNPFDIGSQESAAPIYKHICEQGMTSYFVGGQTGKAFLESKESRTDDLYQLGARYRIIKPICDGLDAPHISEQIIASL